MAPDPDVTLKEFMDVRLEATEDKFDRRFNGLEKKVDGLEKKVDAKVDSLEKKVEALENCITNDIKHVIKVWRYIGSLVVGVLMILAAAWLQQRLGL